LPRRDLNQGRAKDLHGKRYRTAYSGVGYSKLGCGFSGLCFWVVGIGKACAHRGGKEHVERTVRGDGETLEMGL
jgi:hypothetical protein